jgi:hypothetical protein
LILLLLFGEIFGWRQPPPVMHQRKSRLLKFLPLPVFGAKNSKHLKTHKVEAPFAFTSTTLQVPTTAGIVTGSPFEPLDSTRENIRYINTAKFRKAMVADSSVVIEKQRITQQRMAGSPRRFSQAYRLLHSCQYSGHLLKRSRWTIKWYVRLIAITPQR